MGLDPFKYFPVAFAGRQFLEQGIRVKTKKLHQALIGCGIVFILAVFPGEGRPALVEHAGQNHVVAQTNAKAPGRALSQIDKEMLSFHNSPVLKKPGWSKSEIVTESKVVVFILSPFSTAMKTLDKVKLNAG
jgi:hypothetical protein